MKCILSKLPDHMLHVYQLSSLQLANSSQNLVPETEEGKWGCLGPTELSTQGK